MKRRFNLALEAKLRAMQLDDMKYNMLPLDELKENTMIEYENRLQLEKHKQKSSISHRLLIAATLAICLIGGSFLFSVFTPTVVSSANDFVKHISIFVNNAFQLGIDIETPLESPNDGMNGETKTQTDFSSVEEASIYFGVPLLTLSEDMTGYTLELPVAVLGIEPFYSLRYAYSLNNLLIVISYERILDETHINLGRGCGR